MSAPGRPSGAAASVPEVLDALLEINQKIFLQVPTRELASAICEVAARLLGAGYADVRLVEGDGVVLAGHAGPVPVDVLPPRLPIAGSLTGRVVQEGRPLLVEPGDGLATVLPPVPPLVALGLVSFLGLPLQVMGKTIGVFTLLGHRVFTPPDIELATAFAGQAAVAIEHGRLWRATARQAETMRGLAGVGRALLETLDPDVVGQRAADNVSDLLCAHSAALYLIEPGAGRLRMLTRAGDAAFEWPPIVSPGIGMVGLAVAERVPVTTEDTFTDPRVRYLPDSRVLVERASHRALLAVPLLVKGRSLGALVVAAQTGRVFTEEETGLAQSFADQTAVALENARLYEDTARGRREAEIVAEVSRTISASRDLDTILRLVAEGARDLCGGDLALVALRDPGGEGATIRCAAGGRGVLEGLVIEPGKGMGGRVLSSGAPLRTERYADDPQISHEYLDVVRAEGLRGGVVVPIREAERVEGLLYVGQRRPRRFTDHEEATLGRLADHAATAIRNVRLYRETRDYADRLCALEEVNRLVSSSLQMNEVLRNVAAAVARFFEAPYVTVWSVDVPRGRVVREVTYGDLELGRELPPEQPLGTGGVGWVVEHGQAILWSDAAADGRIDGAAAMRRRGLPYFSAYPIALGDRVLGAFAFNRSEPSVVNAETASLLGSLAAQAAVALDNACLHAETIRRLDETRVLLDVTRILNSTLDSTRLLREVAMRIAQVCQVDRCTVSRWDGEAMVLVTSQFADGRQRPDLWQASRDRAPRRLEDVPVYAKIMASGHAVVIDDTRGSDLLPRDWIDVFDAGSYLGVPLIRHDRVTGVMNLVIVGQPRPFQPWQIELAQAIAGQLALALANARLYEEAAERLQETRVLLTVAEILSRARSPAESMRRVAREVARALGADMVGVYELDDCREALRPVAGYHVPSALVETFRAHPLVLARMPGLEEAWRTGRAAWSADVLADPRFVASVPAASSGPGAASYSVLLAPTPVHGNSVGAIFAVWWQAGRQFRPPEVRLIEGVAAQVGLAMENAELARATQAKLKHTETLLSVSRSLSTTLDLETLLRHFLRRVTHALDADSAGVWLLTPDGQSMEPVAGYRVPADVVERSRELRLSVVTNPFYAGALRSRRPALSRDPADGCLPGEMTAVRPYARYLFVPIVAKDRVIGGFAPVWWERERDFSEMDLALMETVAYQAGVAIENARLFEENRRQVEELTVLHELSRVLTGQLDRQAVLEAIRSQVPRLFAVPNAVVVVEAESGDRLELVRLLSDDRGGRPEPYPAGPAAGLAGMVFETGRALRTADYAAECARRGVTPIPEVRSPNWMGVPMRTGDAVAGVLAVSRPERPFTDAEERLLGNIADLAALALRSARLFEERARAYGELAAAQDQLVRTEKLRALGEMASGVAHDFNNLLAAILGRAQLLLKETAHPRQRRWLEVIERSAVDGAQTVRRLQEFTRIRRDHPLIGVDLAQIVRDALEITQSRWREEVRRHDVTIEVRTALAPVREVAGDPVELREALTNIILNAVDAMPGGGVLVVATAMVGGEVHVSVSDTGVGMSPAVRRRIFDPFFTTKGPQGTGLGLAMTYGIVSRHGARIEVESEEGGGSVFRLIFPPTTRVEAHEAAPPAPAIPGVSLRCLVVDDEESVGTLLGDVLESGGHRAVVCLEGADAIARFQAEPFDVVFTDLAMPGLSGWQVARAIKAIARDVPVFVVTGFGVELSSEECRANGVDAILVKPLSIQDVLEAAARVARYGGALGAHVQGRIRWSTST